MTQKLIYSTKIQPIWKILEKDRKILICVIFVIRDSALRIPGQSMLIVYTKKNDILADNVNTELLQEDT